MTWCVREMGLSGDFSSVYGLRPHVIGSNDGNLLSVSVVTLPSLFVVDTLIASFLLFSVHSLSFSSSLVERTNGAYSRKLVIYLGGICLPGLF